MRSVSQLTPLIIVAIVTAAGLLRPGESRAVSNGVWTGTTDQDLAISFTVSDNQVTNLVTNLRLMCSGLGVLINHVNNGSIPIDNNSFTFTTQTVGCTPSQPWNLKRYSFTGNFVHNAQVEGTYVYNTVQSGTWSASHSCGLPSVDAFSASPASINPGESSWLNWSVSGADTVLIDQGIGSVNPGSGNREVLPLKSTNFTLTATNSCGSSHAAARVRVMEEQQQRDMSPVYSILLNNNKAAAADRPYAIPDGIITIDGNRNDWDGIQPVFIDDQGDEIPTADFDGTDIQSLSLAKDQYNLYMLVQLYDGPPKTDALTVYQFQSNQSKTQADTAGDYFVGAYTGGSEGLYVYVNKRTEQGHTRVASYGESHAAAGSSWIEWKAPLAVLGDLNGKYIRVYTHVLVPDHYQPSDDQILNRFISIHQNVEDCNGQAYGTAYVDNCGTCVDGNTGNTACEQDCNGQWGGSASDDACGVCGGDGSSCSGSLGLLCSSDCAGSVCMRDSSTCSDSDLPLPCSGTATGMYCTQSCVSDADCINPNTPMQCLTSCPSDSMSAGRCWTESDYTFMVDIVCPL